MGFVNDYLLEMAQIVRFEEVVNELLALCVLRRHVNNPCHRFVVGQGPPRAFNFEVSTPTFKVGVQCRERQENTCGAMVMLGSREHIHECFPHHGRSN